MRCILGVDFDNTVVDYDDVLWKTAQRMGLIDAGVSRHKKSIRDAIRRMPDGEKEWQEVQAHVYGKAMGEAVLIDGVEEFFRACRQADVPAYIVSHKTEFAARDTARINLRQTALDWMTKKGFFDPKGLGLSVDRVYFESTRGDKVGRIKQLGCTHFIDDLEETFLEDIFPVNVHKMLYAPQRNDSLPKDITVMRNWNGIYDYFFGQGR